MLLCSLCALALPGAAADPDDSARLRRIDVGGYRVDVDVDSSWKLETDPKRGWAALVSSERHIGDEGFVKIGLLHIILPPSARGVDRSAIATAYAVNDVAGVLKAFFGSGVKLVPARRRPLENPKGWLHEFQPRTERTAHWAQRTRFVRAHVFFPEDYARNGHALLVLGLENAADPHPRPVRLDLMDDLLTGDFGFRVAAPDGR